MKRTLLFIMAMLIAFSAMAAEETLWNFSDPLFEDIKNSADNWLNNKQTYVTEDGLTIQGDGRYGWAISINDHILQPVVDGVTYSNSITTTGGVAVAPGHYTIPAKNRYFAVDVAGDSDIKVLARSYNNTPAGKIVITDHFETFIDTIGKPNQREAKWYTFSYFGEPTRLYIYPARWTDGNCGISFYALSATNVVPREGEKLLWDFSSLEFSSLSYDMTFNNKQSYTTEDLLTIHGNGNHGWTYREPDDKVPYFKYKDNEFVNSLETPNGLPVETKTRHFSFPVLGNSHIEVGARSYNRTPSGKLIITDEGNTFLDTVIFYSEQAHATVYSYVYQGEAATLRLIPCKYSDKNDGSVYYFISATNVGENGTSVPENKYQPFVQFNENKILNPNELDIEVFNISGHLLLRSKAATINLENLISGVYIVRDKGSNEIMKILK